MARADRLQLLKEIQGERHALIFNLLWLKSNPEPNCSETDEKMSDILNFILEQIYLIFPEEFPFLAEKLGLNEKKPEEKPVNDTKK
jgi:hypothetical protein